MRRLLLLVTFLVACTPRPPLPAPLPPPESAELLGRLQRNADAFLALDGVAKVRLERAGKSFTATQLLLAEKPDRLRLDLLSPFGQPLLQLTTDGRQLTALLPADAVCYRGAASDRNLQRFTRLPLQASDLIGVLLYQVPLIGYDRQMVTNEGDGIVLRLWGGVEGRQELRFDRDLRLVEASYYLGESLQLRLRYADFNSGLPPFPTSMEFEMPLQEVSAALRFSELRLNPGIADGRFQLAPPAGFEVKELP